MASRSTYDHTRRAMIPLEEAQATVLADAAPLESESVHLLSARGRVLASDVTADEDQPAVALSSRDGWALAAGSGTVDGTTWNFLVDGEARAGGAAPASVPPGSTSRIFTGAPLPPGTDAVVMQEHAAAEGGTLRVSREPRAGDWVRPPGSDCRRGEILVRAGTVLRPEHLGILASMGRTVVPVTRRPVVAFLVNGDEVVDPGTHPCPPGKVRNSNHVSIAALVEEAGAVPLYLGCVGDDREALIRTIRSAPGCDVLVTVGGASVGDYDHVLPVAEELGFQPRFTRIALKPGKPTIYGRGPRCRFVGLPGNPVSCIVVFRLLVEPLLKRLGGRSRVHRASSRAVLAAPERKDRDRATYLPGTTRRDEDGRLVAVPAERRESSALAALRDADCLIVLPRGVEELPAGAEVDVVHLDRDEVA